MRTPSLAKRLALLISLAFGAVSCAPATLSTPDALVNDYFKAVSAQDWKRVTSYVDVSGLTEITEQFLGELESGVATLPDSDEKVQVTNQLDAALSRLTEARVKTRVMEEFRKWSERSQTVPKISSVEILEKNGLEQDAGTVTFRARWDDGSMRVGILPIVRKNGKFLVGVRQESRPGGKALYFIMSDAGYAVPRFDYYSVIQPIVQLDSVAADLVAKLHYAILRMDYARRDWVAWDAAILSEGPSSSENDDKSRFLKLYEEVLLRFSSAGGFDAVVLRESSMKDYRAASAEVRSLEEQLNTVERKIDSELGLLRNLAFESLRADIVNFLPALHSVLLELVIHFRRNSGMALHTNIADLERAEFCSGDLLRDRLLWSYFEPAGTGDFAESAHALKKIERQLSCMSVPQVILAEEAFVKAWSEVGRVYSFGKSPALRQLADRVEARALNVFFLFFEHTKLHKDRGSFSWIRSRRQSLSRAAASAGSFLNVFGIWMRDRGSGELVRLTSACLPPPQGSGRYHLAFRGPDGGTTCNPMVGLLMSFERWNWGVGVCDAVDMVPLSNGRGLSEGFFCDAGCDLLGPAFSSGGGGIAEVNQALGQQLSVPGDQPFRAAAGVAASESMFNKYMTIVASEGQSPLGAPLSETGQACDRLPGKTGRGGSTLGPTLGNLLGRVSCIMSIMDPKYGGPDTLSCTMDALNSMSGLVTRAGGGGQGTIDMRRIGGSRCGLMEGGDKKNGKKDTKDPKKTAEDKKAEKKLEQAKKKANSQSQQVQQQTNQGLQNTGKEVSDQNMQAAKDAVNNAVLIDDLKEKTKDICPAGGCAAITSPHAGPDNKPGIAVDKDFAKSASVGQIARVLRHEMSHAAMYDAGVPDKEHHRAIILGGVKDCFADTGCSSSCSSDDASLQVFRDCQQKALSKYRHPSDLVPFRMGGRVGCDPRVCDPGPEASDPALGQCYGAKPDTCVGGCLMQCPPDDTPVMGPGGSCVCGGHRSVASVASRNAGILRRAKCPDMDCAEGYTPTASPGGCRCQRIGSGSGRTGIVPRPPVDTGLGGGLPLPSEGIFLSILMDLGVDPIHFR